MNAGKDQAHLVMAYPKIETVFDRREDFTVDTDRLRRPEFGLISEWVLTEKVDGTNMRLIFHQRDNDGGTDTSFDVRGKSDNAQVPPQLLNSLRTWCAEALPEISKIMSEFGLVTYTLFGEGYGAKIQSGGRYRSDQGFILFDVAANYGWLDEEQITATAERLGIARVPILSEASTINEAANLCRNGFASAAAETYDPTFAAEGVVARTTVPLYDRRGERVMWKLKAKDFRAGRR